MTQDKLRAQWWACEKPFLLCNRSHTDASLFFKYHWLLFKFEAIIDVVLVGVSMGHNEGEHDGLVCPVTLIAGATFSGQVRTEIAGYFRDGQGRALPGPMSMSWSRQNAHLSEVEMLGTLKKVYVLLYIYILYTSWLDRQTDRSIELFCFLIEMEKWIEHPIATTATTQLLRCTYGTQPFF